MPPPPPLPPPAPELAGDSRPTKPIPSRARNLNGLPEPPKPTRQKHDHPMTQASGQHRCQGRPTQQQASEQLRHKSRQDVTQPSLPPPPQFGQVRGGKTQSEPSLGPDSVQRSRFSEGGRRVSRTPPLPPSGVEASRQLPPAPPAAPAPRAASEAPSRAPIRKAAVREKSDVNFPAALAEGRAAGAIPPVPSSSDDHAGMSGEVHTAWRQLLGGAKAVAAKDATGRSRSRQAVLSKLPPPPPAMGAANFGASTAASVPAGGVNASIRQCPPPPPAPDTVHQTRNRSSRDASSADGGAGSGNVGGRRQRERLSQPDGAERPHDEDALDTRALDLKRALKREGIPLPGPPVPASVKVVGPCPSDHVASGSRVSRDLANDRRQGPEALSAAPKPTTASNRSRSQAPLLAPPAPPAPPAGNKGTKPGSAQGLSTVSTLPPPPLPAGAPEARSFGMIPEAATQQKHMPPPTASSPASRSQPSEEQQQQPQQQQPQQVAVGRARSRSRAPLVPTPPLPPPVPTATTTSSTIAPPSAPAPPLSPTVPAPPPVPAPLAALPPPGAPRPCDILLQPSESTWSRDEESYIVEGSEHTWGGSQWYGASKRWRDRSASSGRSSASDCGSETRWRGGDDAKWWECGSNGGRWHYRQTFSCGGQWKRGYSQWGPDYKRVRREGPASPWFCNICNKDLKREERYQQHLEEDHIPCPEPGCSFTGPEHALAAHKLYHVTGADGKSVVDSPEEIEAWRALRRANWPSKTNLDKKADLEGRRQQLGALTDKPKPSMLEKLLRRAHGLDRSGGKGRDGGFKGKGKKGKGKEKGKGKGKGKGKDGKAKGKGKGKGKGTWSWSYWDDNHGADGLFEESGAVDRAHALVAVALPSMLANCVPLEAPYGNPHSLLARRRTRGVCKYFERGFCFHGDQCQYDHVGASGSSAVAGGLASPVAQAGNQNGNEPIWMLPSTLANRVFLQCDRPAAEFGDGPVSSGRGAGAVIAQRVEPCYPPEERTSRRGLLRRLLQKEVTSFHSAILQCVRYVVATDFFQLERAPLPEGVVARESRRQEHEAGAIGTAADGASGGSVEHKQVAQDTGFPSTSAWALDAADSSLVVPQHPQVLDVAEDEDLDDTDIMELANVLV